MKFHVLFMTVLIFVACAEKKTSAQTNADSVSLETSLETNSNEAIEEIKMEPLIASYDKGLDLILLDTLMDSWFEDHERRKTNSYYDAWQPECPYHGTYWDSNQNIYYYVYKIIEETNSIVYETNINKQREATFLELQEFLDYEQTMPILYFGSILDLERAYFSPSNNTLYIKQLVKIDDSTMEIKAPEDSGLDYLYIPIDFEVFPRYRDIRLMTYTNKQGDILERVAGGIEEGRGKLKKALYSN